MRRIAIVWLLVCGFAMPAVWSAELAGVEMDDQVTVGDETLVLNGMGLRKKLWVEVYVAGLYLPSPTSDAAVALAADGPKRVVMHFLTNKATKKKMDGAWIEGFEANSPDTYGDLEARVRRFADFFGDMKVDDVIELTVLPGTGTSVVLNDQEQGLIEGDDFSTALLRVWLGDHPPTDDLKAGMLGG
jgi:hypothetical protein